MRLAVSCANTHVLAGSFVGLTVMSVGTSLPELATHVVASLQPSLHAVLRGDDPFGRFARLASAKPSGEMGYRPDLSSWDERISSRG